MEEFSSSNSVIISQSKSFKLKKKLYKTKIRKNNNKKLIVILYLKITIIWRINKYE